MSITKYFPALVLGAAVTLLAACVSQPAAADDPDGDPQDQVVHLLRRDRRGTVGPQRGVLQEACGIPPPQQDARHIGQRVPAYGERAEFHEDGIDFRERHF